MLRTTPVRLGMLTTNMPAGGTAVVNPDKFFTGETLVRWWSTTRSPGARSSVTSRHDNNGFRTLNYAVIGQPHRVHWCGAVGLGRTKAFYFFARHPLRPKPSACCAPRHNGRRRAP